MRPEVEAAIGVAEKAAEPFGGGPCTKEMLECIDQRVRPGMRTIETGCGRTTGAFFGAGAFHTICEVHEEKAASVCRPLEEWAYRGLTLRGDSGEALPLVWLNQHEAEFDFALMDGCDTDLTTVTDAIFLCRMLKPGGHLLVDDVDQPWVKRAIEVVTEARLMEKVEDVGGRSVLFRKVG